VHHSDSRIHDGADATWPVWLTLGWLGLCLLLGGGTRQGLVAENLLQLLSLPLLALAIHRLEWRQLARSARLALVLLAGLLFLILLQQVPLPPELWSSLAGRAELAAYLEAAGLTPQWRPLSLDPEATRRAGLAMLPPATVLLLALGLRTRQRNWLLTGLLVLVVLNALLGLAQLAGGRDSPLRWHDVTNLTSAVGSFANRNHFAGLLVVGLVLAGARLVAGEVRESGGRLVERILASLAIATLLVGLAIAASRAGVLLASLGVIGIAGLAWQARRWRSQDEDASTTGVRRWLLLAVMAGLVLSVQFGFWGLMQRLEADPMDDLRWVIAQNTLQASDSFGPLGTGAGSFVRVYPLVEPPEQLMGAYINRAHNDWVEWWLEGGLPMAALLVGALLLLAYRSWRCWRLHAGWSPWPAAACLGLWLVLLHCLVDYPLRTTAMASVTALLAAVALTPDGRRPRA